MSFSFLKDCCVTIITHRAGALMKKKGGISDEKEVLRNSKLAWGGSAH